MNNLPYEGNKIYEKIIGFTKVFFAVIDSTYGIHIRVGQIFEILKSS